MSDNVGLSTPRGSGTSGYIQKNRALMRPRDDAYARRNNDGPNPRLAASVATRTPDQGILEHDRKRAIEVRVFALRDSLEEQELPDDEIDHRCDSLRQQLQTDASHASAPPSSSATATRFKPHQVHEQARAKLVETERLRRALHISKDYEEGAHWRRQDEKQAIKRKKLQDAEEATATARQPPPLPSVEAGDGYQSDRSHRSHRSHRNADDDDDDDDDDNLDRRRRRRPLSLTQHHRKWPHFQKKPQQKFQPLSQSQTQP